MIITDMLGQELFVGDLVFSFSNYPSNAYLQGGLRRVKEVDALTNTFILESKKPTSMTIGFDGRVNRIIKIFKQDLLG